MVKKYYISDTHIDFYIPSGIEKIKYEKLVDEEISKQLLGLSIEDTMKSVLILGGDYSNTSHVSKLYITNISKKFKHIYMVWGNHDYYLDNSKERYKYNRNSQKKINDLENHIKSLGNITVLKDFKVHKMEDGTTISGDTFWYAVKGNYGFYMDMNDSKKILNMSIQTYHEEGLKNFNQLKLKGGSDIIVTHVPPILTKSHSKYTKVYEGDTGLGCYVNSVTMEGLKNKVWLSGHVHENDEYDLGVSKLVFNGYGYDNEQGLLKTVKEIR